MEVWDIAWPPVVGPGALHIVLGGVVVPLLPSRLLWVR